MKLARIIWIAALALLILTACGQKPLLEDVSVSPATITPNADGQTDLAKIEFMLNRNATGQYHTPGRRWQPVHIPPTSPTEPQRRSLPSLFRRCRRWIYVA